MGLAPCRILLLVALLAAALLPLHGGTKLVERPPKLPLSPYQLVITVCGNETSAVSIFIARGDRTTSGANLTDPSKWQVDFSRAKVKPCRFVVRSNKGYAFKVDGVRFF
jgi:hypothetical protein